MAHEKFHYHSIEEIQETAEKEWGRLSMSQDLTPLAQRLDSGRIHSANRIAIQPMEGSDSDENGNPTELTERRYIRFAQGGAGLIWFEAVCNVPEARASLHELYMTDNNVSSFHRLLDDIREAGLKKNGYAPYIVMQATHSGRYSNPNGKPQPLIAYHNPVLEEGLEHLPFHVLTDDELQNYEERFGDSARMAEKAGFDAVDIKCCHRYLASELCSAYDRPGKYGGSFENRTRFIVNAVKAAKAACNIPIACRLNVYDGFPYPWGFGAKDGEGIQPDLTEAKMLAQRLEDNGVELLNITMGNPYKNPHVNRPYDKGNYVPEEHPLYGVGRIMDCCAEMQKATPNVPVIGSGFSYLRKYSAHLAAGMVGEHRVAMAGFGRMALANPDFPNQILREGGLDPKKTCMTCGECAVLLRHGLCAGCVVRDHAQYKSYKELTQN